MAATSGREFWDGRAGFLAVIWSGTVCERYRSITVLDNLAGSHRDLAAEWGYIRFVHADIRDQQ